MTAIHKDFLHEMHIRCDAIIVTAHSLENLASSFEDTGNFEVGRRLTGYAAALKGNANAITRAYARELNATVDASFKATGETFAAAIAHITRDEPTEPGGMAR